MSEKIEPALTAEEWAEWEHTGTSHVAQKARTGVFGQRRLHVNLSPLDPDEGYALAALALYSQPFGFTREDVAVLRKTADLMANARRESQFGIDTLSCVIEPRVVLLRSLAGRIEALLPPDK